MKYSTFLIFLFLVVGTSGFAQTDASNENEEGCKGGECISTCLLSNGVVNEQFPDLDQISKNKKSSTGDRINTLASDEAERLVVENPSDDMTDRISTRAKSIKEERKKTSLIDCVKGYNSGLGDVNAQNAQKEQILKICEENWNEVKELESARDDAINEIKIEVSGDKKIELAGVLERYSQASPEAGNIGSLYSENCNKFVNRGSGLNSDASLYLKLTCESDTCLEDYKRLAGKCYSIKENGDRGFTESEYAFTPVTSTLQLAPQSAQQQGQMAGQAQQQGGQMGQAGLGCRGGGYIYDYNACTKYVGQYKALSMTEKIFLTAQSASMKSLEGRLLIKARASNNVAQAGVDAQRERLEHRKGQLRTMLAVYSTRVAQLNSSLLVWPKEKNIHKECTGKSTQSCCKVLAEEHSDELLANRELRNHFIGVNGELAGKLLALKREFDAIDAQLRGLGDIVAATDTTSQNELLLEYCNSEEGKADTQNCGVNNFNPNFTIDDVNGTGSERDWSVTNVGGTPMDNSVATFDPLNPDKKNQSSTRNGLLDYEDKGEGSGFVNNPSAGRFKKGTGGAGSGGGGGGGAGGGGAPSLSQKQDEGGGDDASLSKTEVGGGYGKQKGKGGYYSKGSARKKLRRNLRSNGKNIGNAFGGLFGNKVKTKSPVGPKNIALFEQISSRYVKVKGDKRINN